VEERITQLKLRPDRADVIIPAAEPEEPTEAPEDDNE